MPAKPEFVVIARIVRPQGRRGEVLADILTDFPEKFAERRQLWLAAENGSGLHENRLQEHWFHKGRIVLKFAGIDSIGDAEALKGQLVQIPLESRALLEPDSLYVSDLVGSAIVDLSGTGSRNIGTIESVQQTTGSAPILIVRNDNKEYEIPLAQEYLVRFDAPGKILEMKLPQGLLEVNAPLSEKKDKKEQKE